MQYPFQDAALLPWSSPLDNYQPTEFLYYGTDKKRGKSIKSAVLTLPGCIMRQRLSSLGHWVRDHWYREDLQRQPNKKHPVVDVLRFKPQDHYIQKPGAGATVLDAYQQAVQDAGQGRDGDLLKNQVLRADNSRCKDKHQWYNSSKARVKEVDCNLLQGAMLRRMKDKRRNYNDRQYNTDLSELYNHKIFTERFLTRRTRESPLGEDCVV